MSSFDFLQITTKNEANRADRLLRAAVSAFCSLPRPSRREIAQLEDLALSLFDQVSVESKRYVAAALSECTYPPAALVRHLSEESVDIAAPLLIRSSALGDIDLLALISRHGLGHAHAISRRRNLNPVIARLVSVLERKVVRPPELAAEPHSMQQVIAGPTEVTEKISADPAPGQAAEDARRYLRSVMRPATSAISLATPAGAAMYARLREAALKGHAATFQATLAEALSTDATSVRQVGEDPSYAWLLDALRLLDISDEKAFLVTAAIYPALFGNLQSIRLFLLRYAAISRAEAKDRIEKWRSGDRPGSSSHDHRAAG
ncbi:MAG: hypothetical protein JNK47_17360 [Mesorhizobium sp.]|nr:hypothetical protein [Mesorhizobium sp.]MBL8578990.1 hypothetical protein [Mesorhizobium sp.]